MSADSILSALLLAGLLPAMTAERAEAAQRKPNIIFIMADDLGYGDLGCYGQTKIQTPNLDRMAQQGIRFTSFYASSTICAPSRASLLTGLHTGHTEIRGNLKGQALTPKDITVGSVLKQAGYHTGVFGKWAMGDENSTGTPDKQGFDEFFGYLNQTRAHNYYPERLWLIDAAGDTNGWVTLTGNLNGAQGQYTHDLFTEAALDFLDRNKPAPSNDNRPFFLYLPYTIPHANNEYTRQTGNGMQVPSDEPYSNESWPQTEKNKAAMITRMDRDVGRLMERLKELDIDDDTVVFFTSDNGPHAEGGVKPEFFNSSGPLRGIKRDLTEGGIRVPMIVRWPGKIKAGRVSDQPWAGWDFLPTAAEIAGTKPPAGIDGISMLPTLLGKKQREQHEFFYWELHEGGFQQAVRMGDWKAIRPRPGTPLELYNLKTDIGEKTNVAFEHPDIVSEIEDYLKTARTESERYPVK